ncbi:MAG: class I SAM-dependent methyltransferase [Actinobacteria bacterium]|nr:class I SAM-dependent methyltransferase [Actinomycetota bacterium]
MGSAKVQGDLWGRAPGDWAGIQEVQHAPLWEAMLDATGVGAGTRFLDAGCGGGGASVLAAGRGAVVSGLDASEPLLEIARYRLPEGDFRVGDLEALPFADGSFGAVIAASSIQYAEDRVAALRELARVAASDGRIAVGLWSTPDKVDYRVVFAAIGDSLPEPPPGDGPFGLSEPGTLEGLIETAGMSVIAAGEADCPFVYPDTETFWKANISAGPLQGAMEVVGEDDLRAAVSEAVAPYRTDDGGLRFENVFRYVTAESAM